MKGAPHCMTRCPSAFIHFKHRTSIENNEDQLNEETKFSVSLFLTLTTMKTLTVHLFAFTGQPLGTLPCKKSLRFNAGISPPPPPLSLLLSLAHCIELHARSMQKNRSAKGWHLPIDINMISRFSKTERNRKLEPMIREKCRLESLTDACVAPVWRMEKRGYCNTIWSENWERAEKLGNICDQSLLSVMLFVMALVVFTLVRSQDSTQLNSINPTDLYDEMTWLELLN